MRTRTFHELFRALGCQVNKGKAVGNVLETIFYGYACHSLDIGAGIPPIKAKIRYGETISDSGSTQSPSGVRSMSLERFKGKN